MKYDSCFLGIPLPSKLLNAYTNLQKRIRKIDSSLTLQDPNIMEPHITIYYCSQQTEEVLKVVAAITENSKDLIKGLSLNIGGLDFFTKEGFDVLFLDVVFPKELTIFQEEINNSCSKFYRDNEVLEFHPHMTVGGFNTSRSTEETEQNLLKLKAEFGKVDLEFPITDLVIYGVDPADPRRIHQKLLTTTIG